MATMRLTETAVKNIAAPADVPQDYYWDTTVKGFGMVVGRSGQKTFVVYSRLAGERGKRVKHKIGVHLQPRDDKHVWTVELAREAAKKVIGKLASGTNPNEPVGADGKPAGPTVREG